MRFQNWQLNNQNFQNIVAAANSNYLFNAGVIAQGIAEAAAGAVVFPNNPNVVGTVAAAVPIVPVAVAAVVVPAVVGPVVQLLI